MPVTQHVRYSMTNVYIVGYVERAFQELSAMSPLKLHIVNISFNEMSGNNTQAGALKSIQGLSILPSSLTKF